jgi:hypothetical protein
VVEDALGREPRSRTVTTPARAARQSVLFVCTHNSARSQMAEAMLRDMAGDRFRVASAGMSPMLVHPLAESGDDRPRSEPPRAPLEVARRSYFTGDRPDLQKVARGWEAKLTRRSGARHDELRVAACAPKLEEKEWADFFDYQERLNGHLSDKRMLVLCLYPIPTSRAGDVERTHLSTLMKRHGETR